MFCEFTKTISFILLLKKVRSLEGNERVYGAFVKNWQDFRFLLVSQFPSKSKIFCEFTNTISSQFAFKCWHSESAWVQFLSGTKKFCEFTKTISSLFAFKCWHLESAWVQFLSGTKKFCEFAKTISFILLKIVWSLKDNVYMGLLLKTDKISVSSLFNSVRV